MNQEKLIDYLDYFQNNHQAQNANIGAIISKQENFNSLLNVLKNDFILIEINNQEHKKQLQNFLRMRDDYKNFVIFFTEEIVGENMSTVTNTIRNQKNIANTKLLILSTTNNFDNLNLFNLTNSTCRIS